MNPDTQISDIQPWVAGLIAAHPKFVAAGIKVDNTTAQHDARHAGQDVPAAARGIVIEDGTFPKTPGLEDALAKKGLGIVVWFVTTAGIIGTSKTGVSNQTLMIVVVIQENTAVNRKAGGTQIKAEDAYKFVYQAIAGKKMDGDPINTNVEPHHEPFDNLGTVNGIWTIVGNFTKQLRLGPLND